MASDVAGARQLLVKFRADLRSLKSDFSEVQRTVQSMNKSLSKDKDKAKREAAQEIRAALDGERQKQAAAQTTIKVEQQKQAVIKTEQLESNKTLLIKKEETLEIQKQIAAIRVKAESEKAAAQVAINAIRQQQAALRLQQQQSVRGATGNAGNAGFLASLVGGVSRAAGGGVAGGVLSGILLGGGIYEGVKATAEGIEHLIEKMKEFIKESGPLQQVNDQFQQLTKNAHISADEFLKQLRGATRGLVDEKIDLLRLANAGLRSNMKLTEEDMVRFTRNVSEMARSLGKSVPQAVQVATRALATGRTMYAGRFLELNQRELRPQRVAGQTIIGGERAQFEQINQALETRLRKTGFAPDTLTEQLQRMKVTQKELFETIGQGFATSTGAKSFIDSLGKIIEKFGGAEEAAKRFGRGLGDILATAGKVFLDLLNVVGKLRGVFSSSSKNDFSWLDNVYDRLTSIKGIMLTLYNIWNTIIYGAEKLAAVTKLVGTVDWQGMKHKWATYKEDIAKADEGLESRDYAMKMGLIGPGVTVEGKKGLVGKDKPTTDPAILQEQRKLAQLQLHYVTQAEKEKLLKVQESLDDQRDALKKNLSEGVINIETYVKKVKALNEEEKKNKINQLDAELNAEVKKAQVDLKTGSISKPTYNQQIKNFAQQHATQIAAIERQTHKENIGANNQLEQDKNAAKKKAVEEELQISLAAINTEQEAKKDSYNKLLLDANDYIESQKQGAESIYQAEVAAAEKRYNLSKSGEADLETLIKQETDAWNKKEKAKTAVTQQEVDERIKYAQRVYSTRIEYLTNQQGLAAAQAGPGGVSTSRQRSDIASQIAEALTEISTLNSQLKESGGTVEKFSSQWYEINNLISSATERVIQLQTQMYGLTKGPSSGILGGFGGLFAAFAGAGFGGHNARGAEQGFSFLQNLSQLTAPRLKTLEGTTTLPPLQLGGATLPGSTSSFTGYGFTGSQNVFSQFGDAVKKLVKGTGDVQTRFQDFAKAMSPVISTVGQGVQAIAQGGVLGGISAGAGLGGQAGEKLGEMFKGLGKVAGPIGEVAGAALGGILSSIIGKKVERAEQWLRKMQVQFNQVVLALKDGSVGLNVAIQQMQGIRDQVNSQLKGSKKKTRSMYQSEVNAMNDQIMQMQAQQLELVRQMQQQVVVTGQSPQMQQYTTQLQQMIQQYAQFAGAARNAIELGQANQFLANSLKNFGKTELESLNQAEQQAIQDALQLNDLYRQRQLLLQNEASQEYSIMTQGILTRQTTQAQSKMEQIALLKQQDALQLEQLNMQISVTQFKVDSEKKIFNLATTRIGLEAQLIALQNNSTLLQMAQIAALQQVVSALSDPNFASNLTKGINFANYPAGTAFDNLIKLLGANGGTGNNLTDASNQLLEMFLAQYNRQSGYGFGGFSLVGGGS